MSRKKIVEPMVPSVRYRYKLHGIDTVNGVSNSSNVCKFYETLEEAQQVAESYCARAYKPCDGIVIFKAVQLVRPVGRPIEVLSLDE